MKKRVVAAVLCGFIGVCGLTGCDQNAAPVEQVQLSPEEAKKQALDKVLENKEIELYKIVTIGESQDELLLTSNALTPERFGYLSEAKFYQYDSNSQEYKLLSDLEKPIWYTDIYKPVKGIPSEMVFHSILQGSDNNIYYTAGYGRVQVDRLVKKDDAYKWEVVVEDQPLTLSNNQLEGKTRTKYGMKDIPFLLNASKAENVTSSSIKLNEDQGRFVAKGKLLYVNGTELKDTLGHKIPSQASAKDMHLILLFNEDTDVPVFIEDNPDAPVGYSEGHNEIKKVKYLELRIPNGLQFDTSALNSNHEFFDGSDVMVSIDPSNGGFMHGSSSTSSKIPVYDFYKFL